MKINVAIVGVGNCACSLVQGIEYYKDAEAGDDIPGLMHPVLGDYKISDINIVAAFDVVKGKVGVDLADAIWAAPNDTVKFATVPQTGVTVQRGSLNDGIGKYLRDIVEIAPIDGPNPAFSVVEELITKEVDVLVSYLPVGSEFDARFYAQAALDSGCAFINCMPAFLTKADEFGDKFAEAGLPIIGDDIKSQVGATIVHRVLASLFHDRGVKLDRTMQLNVGGNSDFLNMLERERLTSKKISKTQAVTSIAGVEFEPGDIHVGPSDHVPWLTDRKWAYIRLEGRGFGDVPLNAELKLEVWDSPNSAGVVIDAIRLAATALDRNLSGPIHPACSYLFKSPPQQVEDGQAREDLEYFIRTV